MQNYINFFISNYFYIFTVKMTKTIAIGADHGGFKLKEELKKYFKKKGIKFKDLGAHTYEKTDDFPDIAFKVSEYVTKHKTKGILICTAGIGMSIAANKYPGIRAAKANTIQEAIMSRRDNDSNILCLGTKTNTGIVKRMISAYLNEKFHGGRHARRMQKIRMIEQYHKIT